MEILKKYRRISEYIIFKISIQITHTTCCTTKSFSDFLLFNILGLLFIFPYCFSTYHSLCQDKTMHLLFLYDFKTLFLKMKINNIVLLCVFLYFFLSKFYIIFQ